ncbi:MAG: tetratricopeptide repeat protein, partial [Candidatus Eisenbacteria bacterium]|nr:tetratricopeptide repeat protein [Candidatus Eisenbacteria bacterium]
NEPYEGTEYQRSARSWTPAAALWEEVKRRSKEAFATITFAGFDSSNRSAPVSRGSVRILTSKDPVGAPFFYRDVPLMPALGKAGTIRPLGTKAIPLIGWRLRDVSMTDSKLVLTGMSACGNCHSFSLDGRTLGMDVDGPDGDKGMYTLKSVSRNMVIDYEDTFTWNSFPGKPEGHKTIGFLSRVSPDGRYVASTANEAVFVANFTDHEFLQVFYPTRGILVYYSRSDGRIQALPGADDTDYVHCDPVWSPDGEFLVFARGNARDPYSPGQKMPKHANDPNELEMLYSLYRIPFNDGKGGEPVPVEGASHNGMSNNFPKVSPDGKWIVFVKCKNGQLMRPDSRLWIVPFEGGEAREMRCNTDLMNSWHSFSPNSRWMVFSSKSRTPYTQAFLTHIDEDGNDSPAILVPNCTAANRAVNLPEFLNTAFENLDTIDVPAVRHHVHILQAERHAKAGEFEEAIVSAGKALEADPTFVRALNLRGFAHLQLDDAESAVPDFERAQQISPRDDSALFNLGVAFRRLGRPRSAVRCLEKLLEVIPWHRKGAEILEFAKQDLRRLQDEVQNHRETVKANPEDGHAHFELSHLYRRLDRIAESADHLEKAAMLLPEDPAARANLAWILATSRDAALRDGARAVSLARRAVALTNGERPEPLDVLAAALAEAGRFEEALSTAERALELSTNVAPPLVPQLKKRIALYRSERPVRTGPRPSEN